MRTNHRVDTPWATRLAAWGLWVLAGIVGVLCFGLAMFLSLATVLLRGPRDPLDLQTLAMSLMLLAVGGATVAALYCIGRGLMEMRLWAWLLGQAVYCLTALLAAGGEVVSRLMLGHRQHLGQGRALALAVPSLMMLVLLLMPASIQRVLRPFPIDRHKPSGKRHSS